MCKSSLPELKLSLSDPFKRYFWTDLNIEVSDFKQKGFIITRKTCIWKKIITIEIELKDIINMS